MWTLGPVFFIVWEWRFKNKPASRHDLTNLAVIKASLVKQCHMHILFFVRHLDTHCKRTLKWSIVSCLHPTAVWIYRICLNNSFCAHARRFRYKGNVWTLLPRAAILDMQSFVRHFVEHNFMQSCAISFKIMQSLKRKVGINATCFHIFPFFSLACVTATEWSLKNEQEHQTSEQGESFYIYMLWHPSTHRTYISGCKVQMAEGSKGSVADRFDGSAIKGNDKTSNKKWLNFALRHKPGNLSSLSYTT